MSMGLTVDRGERGLVRVFALSMTEAEAKAFRENTAQGDEAQSPPQAAALGLDTLNSDFTEVIRLSDLSEIGLTGYLIEGNGIDPAALAPDRAKLDALDGWVFLVYSSAFGGQSTRLDPVAELTLIGTYAEPGVDWSERRTLASEAAKSSAVPEKKRPSDAAISGRIALGALVVISALTALMIWIAAR